MFNLLKKIVNKITGDPPADNSVSSPEPTKTADPSKKYWNAMLWRPPQSMDPWNEFRIFLDFKHKSKIWISELIFHVRWASAVWNCLKQAVFQVFLSISSQFGWNLGCVFILFNRGVKFNDDCRRPINLLD